MGIVRLEVSVYLVMKHNHTMVYQTLLMIFLLLRMIIHVQIIIEVIIEIVEIVIGIIIPTIIKQFSIHGLEE